MQVHNAALALSYRQVEVLWHLVPLIWLSSLPDVLKERTAVSETYADVCSRLLTYAHVSSCMLCSSAYVSIRDSYLRERAAMLAARLLLGHVHGTLVPRMLTYADVR